MVEGRKVYEEEKMRLRCGGIYAVVAFFVLASCAVLQGCTDRGAESCRMMPEGLCSGGRTYPDSSGVCSDGKLSLDGISGGKLSLDGIEKTASVIYRQSSQKEPYLANPYGRGVFASKTINGERRKFLVTANHVLKCARYGDDFAAIQAGVAKKGAGGAILRATMPENEVRWLDGDEFHDVVAADITDSMHGLEKLDAEIRFVDLDSVRDAAKGDRCTLVGAKEGESRFANDEMSLWTSPFKRKEGVFVAVGTDRLHEFASGAAGGCRMLHRGDVAAIRCTAGESGSPVFVHDGCGAAQFCGIAIGADAGTVNIVPARTIARYIDAAYGVNISTRPLPDEALREVAATTVRVNGTERFETWRPGLRRVVLEVAGTCTASNAFEACAGTRYRDDDREFYDDVAVKVGWDNIDLSSERTEPGFKKAVFIFDLDETGRTVASRMAGDCEIEYGCEPKKVDDLKYGREWNMLRLKTRGGSHEDSYARIIQYAAKE